MSRSARSIALRAPFPGRRAADAWRAAACAHRWADPVSWNRHRYSGQDEWVDKDGQTLSGDALRRADRRVARAAAHVGAPPRVPGAAPRRTRPAPLRASTTCRASSPSATRPPSGVPIPEAIARARAVDDAPGAPAPRHARRARRAPADAGRRRSRGPAPMRVEYVNGALRALPGAPRPRRRADRRGARASRGLGGRERARSACSRPTPRPTEVHHPAWGGHARHDGALDAVPPARRRPARRRSSPMRRARGRRRARRRARRWPRCACELDDAAPRATRATRAGSTRLAAARRRRSAASPSPRRRSPTALDAVVRQTDAVDGARSRATPPAGSCVARLAPRPARPRPTVVVAAHPALARCAARRRAGVARARGRGRARRARRDCAPAAVPVAVAGRVAGRARPRDRRRPRRSTPTRRRLLAGRRRRRSASRSCATAGRRAARVGGAPSEPAACRRRRRRLGARDAAQAARASGG